MMSKLKYLDGEVPAGFKPLMFGQLIESIGMGLVSLFLPIFVFEKLNYQLDKTLFYFLAGFLLYGLLIPFIAKTLNPIGLNTSLRISVFLNALF